jgi:hypothetical protein
MTAITAEAVGARSTTAPAARPHRGWALAGVGAGVAGIVGIAASMSVDAVYDDATQGNPAAIVDKLGTQVPQLLVFHVATMIAALLLPVVAAGLARRLSRDVPADSLLPRVASYGLLLVSVAALIGTALDTEFVFAVADDDNKVVPEAAAFFGHWVGTVPWVWAGAGIAAMAVGLAARQHRAAGRFVAITSIALGAITLLFAVSPLQYMAGMTGPVWLLLASVAFLRDRC